MQGFNKYILMMFLSGFNSWIGGGMLTTPSECEMIGTEALDLTFSICAEAQEGLPWMLRPLSLPTKIQPGLTSARPRDIVNQ
jgi:hypothetical protein